MAKNKKIEEKFSYSDLDDLLYNMEWAGVTHPFRGKDIDSKLLGESTDDKDLSEFFDVTLDAHDFGGTGNKVSVLGGPNPFSEALEDEPGYDELLQYIHNRRAKKRKNESLEKDMSDEEFVEAFGQELVKNNIKPKKACKGKNCKVLEDLNGYDEEDFGIDTVKEGWSELYDEDGMDNYDFSDINADDFDLTWDDEDADYSAEPIAQETDKLADTSEPETDPTVSMDLDPDNWDWDWDDNVTCGWCNETYPKGDCRKDKQLGYICPQCQQEIASRGEPMDYES